MAGAARACRSRRALSRGRGREIPWGGGDAHFPRCALYPRPPPPHVLLLGDGNMCGLVSESALHRVRPAPTSSGAWSSDFALWRAPGDGALGGSPPGFEGAPPQVRRQSPFWTWARGSRRNPWGAWLLGALRPEGRPAGWVRAGALVPGSARRRRQRQRFAVAGFRTNRVTVSFSQDRQDGSSNGNPRLPHLSSAGQHLYSPAPPLSHTGVAEYQPPPYFPPPYQPLSYSQSADPYSHLGEAYAAINPLHQPAPAGSQPQAWPGRQSQEAAGLPSHHGRPAGLLPHLSGLDGGAMSARRDGFRRSDLLLPHAHALDAAGLAENLGLHDMGPQMDEVQVSAFRVLPPPARTLSQPLAQTRQNLKETVFSPPDRG